MPTVDYAMSVRSVSKGKFVAGIGPTRFLAVPDGADPDPAQAITASAWYKAVTDAGKWTNDKGEARGDILFVVHGYNESETEVMDRHRRIRYGLAALAFKGVIVSFDWPSGASALAYLPDRHRAKQTALQLVSDGIAQLAARQTPDCPINIHILGHSTGAYVIREAFDDADDSQLRQSSWLVSQILFAAGDVSSGSMAADDSGAKSVYRHCLRLTNYSNRNDSVLDISNVKRLGVAPRVGRIGLPPDSPAIAVNIDCTELLRPACIRQECAESRRTARHRRRAKPFVVFRECRVHQGRVRYGDRDRERAANDEGGGDGWWAAVGAGKERLIACNRWLCNRRMIACTLKQRRLEPRQRGTAMH